MSAGGQAGSVPDGQDDRDRARADELESLRPYLMRFARGKLRDVHAVEDVVQETLLAALTGKNAFMGRSRLRTWVTSILNHKIIDIYRRHRAEHRQDAPGTLDDADDWQAEELFHAMTEPDARLTLMDPAEEVARQQLAAHLHSAVAALPARQRDAFVLVHMHGCSGVEAARQVGITQSNLWIILHRTRKTLQAALRMRHAV
ncbi:MAG: sigma-70 family RNA polymerase sigma factor [Betaproteobacteria bacterium]